MYGWNSGGDLADPFPAAKVLPENPVSTIRRLPFPTDACLSNRGQDNFVGPPGVFSRGRGGEVVSYCNFRASGA